MQHTMTLQPKPFERIRKGQKTIEMRLYDSKRRQIQPGDTILFTCTASPYDTLTVQVQSLHIFPDFVALYAALPLTACGYTEEELPTASPDDMTQYYTPTQQKQCGVVGIRIVLMKSSCSDRPAQNAISC